MINAYLIDRAILLVDPLLFLTCMLLLWYTAPPREIARAYPFRVHLLSSLPFSNQWRKEVAPDHIRAIRRSRVALFVCLVMIAMAALLKFAYYEFFFAG
ncbi:MAG TPA: hypothetical protein VHS07_05020, partial [Candidatus Binataceae bacterium]|nr:hypothetical protein [Candidatus Binataceae bacterium]